jgi:hypothetical protein
MLYNIWCDLVGGRLAYDDKDQRLGAECEIGVLGGVQDY